MPLRRPSEKWHLAEYEGSISRDSAALDHDSGPRRHKWLDIDNKDFAIRKACPQSERAGLRRLGQYFNLNEIRTSLEPQYPPGPSKYY